jgi:AraC-like DNA-binding protein
VEPFALAVFPADRPGILRSVGYGEYFAMSFHSSLLDELGSEKARHVPNAVFKVTSQFSPKIEQRMKRLFSGETSLFEGRTRKLIKDLFASLQDVESTKIDTRGRYINSSLLYVSKTMNHRRRISLGELADAASCSPRTFEYAFRCHLNMGPKTYIDLARLNHLSLRVKGLASTEISEVAHDMGYTNLSRLIRSYKTLFLNSPYDVQATSSYA